MAFIWVAVLFAAAYHVLATSTDMGPASFMWPPDRAWSGQMDNTAPCGSVDSVVNRTEFPLAGGKVSLTAQDDSYGAFLSISFKNDPKTQSDFNFVLNTIPITEIDPGHTCFRVADPPSDIAPGTNATIQLMYTADFDRPENQTFYACADITYVRPESFTTAIPCFNATEDTDVPAPTSTGVPTGLPGHGDNEPPLTTPGATPKPASGGVVLSKGAIAGIVVGTVVGLALIAGLALLFYRERQKKNRLERQRDSARGVKWVEDPAKDTASAGSFRLQSMPSPSRA
ncbi:hypothetical protein B0H67DRAFT_608839 [Lasiosphaeris hirsuta]|uniref:Copper acquisition factor BIM1-like domain-containing protein n=1 Tax=Lasiosphaeris hirsuta TaxID=260670 RepID=A0AA40DYA4_9PEZI|nr:hypothetical protein B0H67DRAFT_608839 [Lasiosphaeris hirsuta]